MSYTSRLLSNEREFIIFPTQIFFKLDQKTMSRGTWDFPWYISGIRHWFYKVWSDVGEVFVKHVAGYCLWNNIIFFLVPDDSTEFLQMTGFNTRNYCYHWLVLNFEHVASWPMGTHGCLCMYCLLRCIRDLFIYIHIYYELNAITEYRDIAKMLLQGVHFTPIRCFDVKWRIYYVLGLLGFSPS